MQNDKWVIHAHPVVGEMFVDDFAHDRLLRVKDVGSEVEDDVEHARLRCECCAAMLRQRIRHDLVVEVIWAQSTEHHVYIGTADWHATISAVAHYILCHSAPAELIHQSKISYKQRKEITISYTSFIIPSSLLPAMKTAVPEIILRVIWRPFSTLCCGIASASQQLAHIVNVCIHWRTCCTIMNTKCKSDCYTTSSKKYINAQLPDWHFMYII